MEKTMNLAIKRIFITLIGSLAFLAQPAGADSPTELSVGIVPQQSASALSAVLERQQRTVSMLESMKPAN